MEQIDYRKILAESSSGYAYYRLILDDNGTPADYQFIEVNKAFERLTGTDSVNIVGRRITEIIRDEKHEVYDLIKQYGEIVLSGQSREFEQYSRHLNRWYRVEVTPQDDLSFVTIYSDITELKQSTSKLMQYMEYAPDGIFIADNRGKFVSVNPAGCRILGFGEDELRNMSITDFVTPESRESSIDGIRTILVSGSDKRELLLKRNGGDRIWVSLKTERLPDGTFMGFCRDITDRKAAEAGLKQYAMFNKTLIETIPLPVYYKDLDGNYIGLNKAMEVLYGKTRDEFEGKSVSDVSPAPAAERYKKHDYELLKNPGVLMFEDQWIDYYGETRDVIFHKATFNNLDGSVGGIIGAIVDITDFKKTHRELELYFKAIQAVAQPVLLTDSKGNIIRVNNAFINMYGFTFDELAGRNPNILNPGKDVYINFGYTEEEYAELFRSMWQSISNHDEGTWENILINRKKDGSLIWVKLIINAVYNDEHIPVNYIALPVDITGTLQKETITKVELYQTIAALAELRDNETGNHMRRVGIYAKLLARGYNMPEKYCNDIEVFAPLHDIGKVGILDSLLLAERNLLPSEFDVMKTHTVLGHNIVKGKKELEMVAAITIAHHEWYDGSGYPKGISGLDIPLSARITAVADVYDALRSRRPYKGEWTHEDAVKYITGKAGVQFDPDIIEIFRKISDRFEKIYMELKD